MGGLLQDAQVVCAYLVAGAPGAAVDDDGDLALLEPERLRSGLIVDLLDRLYLEEVVAAAQGAELGLPPPGLPG